MAKYHEYEGGDWSTDSSALHENRLSDQANLSELTVRHKLITERYLPHAQQRIAEGCKPYVGIAAEYQQELSALVAQLGSMGYTRTYNLIAGGALLSPSPDSRQLFDHQLAGVSFSERVC